MTLDAATTDARTLYRIMSTAVAPRPICFASTVDAEGLVNLSPYSFFNVVSVAPPILAFAPLYRGTDGSAKDTLNNIRATGEVTINVVEYGIVEQMSLTSVTYPPDVNEFDKGAFTERASELVKPPRVGEAAVSFECTVDQVVELGQEAMGGSLVLARIRRVHLADRILNSEGKIDGQLLDLVGRMGGNAYVHAAGSALFEVPKPTQATCIGVDGLPDYVRNSSVLTGNNLGRLGNLQALPSAAEVAKARSDERVQYALLQGTDTVELLAKELIEAGETQLGLATLLLTED